MSETYQFKLPYLQASQAQKHVTVNDALARIDALAQLRVQSRVMDVPASPVDGQNYIVPDNATGAWAGQEGAVAMFNNGGWIFAPSQTGWVAWVLDEAVEVRFDGVIWGGNVAVIDPNLGAISFNTVEFDHTIVPGLSNLTTSVIPDNAIVYGVSGRIIQAINGPSTILVGVASSSALYGLGYGVALNTPILGVTPTPLAYLTDTPLIISAGDSNSFVDGVIRLCIHFAALTPPVAV
jgi:hypothetical protein